VDDPTITQPLLYERIKNHAPLWKIYAERTGIDSTQDRGSGPQGIRGGTGQGARTEKNPAPTEVAGVLGAVFAGRYKPEYEVDTGLTREKLAEITDGLVRVPEGFHLHPKNREASNSARKWGM